VHFLDLHGMAGSLDKRYNFTVESRTGWFRYA